MFDLRAPKRAVLLGALLVAVAAAFWSGSRYPDLDRKAMMGGGIRLEDPLSFEALLPIQEGTPLWQRVAYSTLNWIDTNKRGMTFGITLGAILLTLLKTLRARSLVSSTGNTVLGVLIGAPLGLCVNCAAPVAKSLHHGGARLETTLVAMVSSPTLNVIVLTMIFSMFPAYMAITKVLGTLVFVFLVIPFLSRFVFRTELARTIENAATLRSDLGVALCSNQESWHEASAGAVRDLLASLWLIVRTTVPLMLLAGFLGAAVASLLPLDSLAGLGTGLAPMVLLAVVGIFLPVPMAFDVVVCSALRAAGMAVPHVMVLLFTLGIFSVYSFFILYTTVSPRVACSLAAILASMGILSGLVAGEYHARQVEHMLDFYNSHASDHGSGGRVVHAAVAPEAAVTPRYDQALVARQRLAPPSIETSTRIARQDFRPRSPWEGRPFTKHEGWEFGLHRPILFSARDFWEPFLNGRGVAAGDVDNDGWIDVALATEEGVLLFGNQRGHFERLTLPAHEELNAFVVALVDIDNDGWLDIFFTVYDDGNYYLLNDRGRFSASRLHRIANRGAVHTQALTFGDIDEDGDLDTVLGNFFFGNGGPIPVSDRAADKILINKEGAYRGADAVPLQGMPGETFSVLLSDFDSDGRLDLIVANDWAKPDYYFLGDGRGGFRMLTKEDAIIPQSPWSTMSVDSSDVNNDLIPDIYAAQIAGRPDQKTNWVPRRSYEHYCSEISRPEDHRTCQRNVDLRDAIQLHPVSPPMDIEKCESIAGKYDGEKNVCMAMWLMQAAMAEKEPELCDVIKSDQARVAKLCRRRFERGTRGSELEWASAIPQVPNDNVLLVGQQNGRFVDRAKEFGIDKTDWAWNAKFADLDNDEWPDLYVANGTWWIDGPRSNSVPTNVFFLNRQGQRFEEKTDEFGLQDFAVVTAYAPIDIDNDGDLDLVTNAVNAPIRVYVNGERSNQSIAFELRDHVANRFGIGSRVIIHYGEGGSFHQMRELKSGGGFLSFDAPVAYFGLGGHSQVERADVVWSTGEPSRIDGPFHARAKYTISRGTLE